MGRWLEAGLCLGSTGSCISPSSTRDRPSTSLLGLLLSPIGTGSRRRGSDPVSGRRKRSTPTRLGKSWEILGSLGRRSIPCFRSEDEKLSPSSLSTLSTKSTLS